MQKACCFNIVMLIALCSVQQSCLKGAHPDFSVSQGFGWDQMNSAYFNTKFNKLVQLTKEGTNNPQGPRAYGTAFGSYREKLKQLFTNAQDTGLVAQYKQLLLGQNQGFQKGEFLELLVFNPETLIEIAVRQNLYGNEKPFDYDASRGSKAGPNPVIGYYYSSKGELTITSYGFLHGLIDAIDQLDKSADLRNLLSKFDSALDKAIAMQRKASTNLNFDETMEKLRKLYNKGNTKIAQDLAEVLSKYQ